MIRGDKHPAASTDQLAACKAALAAYRKRQRTERARGYRPRRGLEVAGPGMVRVRPRDDTEETRDAEEQG